MALRVPSSVLGSVLILVLSAPVAAIEIDGVGNGALDQPRVNTRLIFNGSVLDQPDSGLDDLAELLGLDPGLLGLSPTNIEAYYDTGAGVGLFGSLTANNFDIPTQSGAGFTDVGVGGVEAFGLSQALTLEIGSTSPNFNPSVASNYKHSFSNHVVAIGNPPTGYDTPAPGDVFEEALEQYLAAQADFNVLGMPYFDNKTVVMDARALNAFAVDSDSFFDLPDDSPLFAIPQLYTHVYDQNAANPAFNPANINDPGIPSPVNADLTIELNFANFNSLTQTTGGTAPNLAHNPMIGGALPSQFNETIDDRDDNDGVTITRGTASSEGTWLFDTGAAASIISVEQAEALGVFYRTGEEPSESGPVTLIDSEGNEIADQFELTLGGVGGNVTVAGFFLDALTIPTTNGEGLTFLNAPVLVADISVPDAEGGDPFTLDGILGMNFLFASTFIDGEIDLTTAGELATIVGAFDWVVYDETNNLLHLHYSSAIPEPVTVGLLLMAASPAWLLGRHRV